MISALHGLKGLAGLALLGLGGWSVPVAAQSIPCIECISVRVGPPVVVRGPFPDELDAPFTALKLSDGTIRAFTANGITFAVDGPSLWDLRGPRVPVLEPGPEGSINDCGRWLTTALRTGDAVLGFVHQERSCDYAVGQSDKSMALAISRDDGLTWTDLGTVISGRDSATPGVVTGEGDCTMVDGHDGFLYAYCLRNSDWQTIVARTPAAAPTDWRKYHEGAWTEPGLGGAATEVGFIGPGAGYLVERGLVATVATDPWFGGVRLSLSQDKITFADLKEPLVTIDDSGWERPAPTDLVAYGTIVNPDDGSNSVGDRFLLAYIYVPPGAGFESRYLVFHEVALSDAGAPQPVQVGMALTRWADAIGRYVTSSGPLTGPRLGYQQDAVVAYLLTRAPDTAATVKLAECGRDDGNQMLAVDGQCETLGYTRERTAGWLYADAQPGTIPVYRCRAATGSSLASSSATCEGLGTPDTLLGYGIAP